MNPISHEAVLFIFEIFYLLNFIWLKLWANESFLRSHIGEAVGMNYIEKKDSICGHGPSFFG